MSRIGKLPIIIPQGVEVTAKDNLVTVKGPLGQLEQKVNDELSIELKDTEMVIDRPTDSIEHKSMHGLYRSLVSNMIQGVSEGFAAQLELVGVGFKAENQGKLVDFSLGYSHHIIFEIPEEVQVECKTEKRANTIISLKSHDKQLLGHVVAKIRSLRPVEPYKGKGIRFVGEVVRKKAGKTASV